MKNIKHNLIGKINGKTVVSKLGMTYPDARELKQSWEQQGCPLIMDEQRQLVKLDRIEMEAVEVLWSGGVKEAELEMAEYMRDLELREQAFNRMKEAKVGA